MNNQSHMNAHTLFEGGEYNHHPDSIVPILIARIMSFAKEMKLKISNHQQAIKNDKLPPYSKTICNQHCNCIMIFVVEY